LTQQQQQTKETNFKQERIRKNLRKGTQVVLFGRKMKGNRFGVEVLSNRPWILVVSAIRNLSNLL